MAGALQPPSWTQGQIRYMVDAFQPGRPIQKQLEEGYAYRLITVEGRPEGYMAYRSEEGRLFLSKLYLRREARAGVPAGGVLSGGYLPVNRPVRHPADGQ